MATDPARRRRRRRRDAPRRARAARRHRARDRRTRSTTRPTRAIERRASRRATSRLELGRLAGVPVVLGSATPSVETEGRARDGEIERHRLPDATQRGAAADRGRRPSRRARGRQRRDALALARRLRSRRLQAGEQAILVINRRGTASVVLCRDCGHVADVSRLHAAARLPPGRPDAPLPPLRSRLADAVALPELRLGPDPVPRRRHGATRARGEGPVPGPSGRAAGSRRRRAAGRRGPRRRRLHRRAARRPRRARASSRRASTSRP